MTDHHVAAPQGLHVRRDGPMMRDDRSRGSQETGESSTRGNLLEPTTSTDRTLAFSDDDDGGDAPPHTGSRDREHSSAYRSPRDGRSRRSHKARAGGSFLLQDAVAGEGDNGHRRRQSRKTPPSKGKVVLEPRLSSAGQDVDLGIESKYEQRQASVTPKGSQEDLVVRKRGSSSRDGSRASHSPQSPSMVDVDSTQIVNMALNLSESRRIASRRSITRANPPRLAPIPDATPGGNLRAHLQQQRKTHRNISPRPHHALTPRLPSNVRSNSPLQAAFDSGYDGSYRYHFSTSTLSRAQKAREHLELMAQYRRLLEVLPPLKPRHDRPSVLSPPGSPPTNKLTKSGTTETGGAPTGREYNPLQYIRNRKVRARERKAIDGELQGFSDVDSVRLWVDRATRGGSSIGGISVDGEAALPPFPGAEEAEGQASPDASGKAALRLRRPRVDWFFEPCDMIADAYWLEQDHHKQLIENRDWCKIFPPASDLSRPMSHKTEDNGIDMTPLPGKTLEEVRHSIDGKDLALLRPDTEVSQSSAKERAKQKFHDMKSSHRHSASTHSHHDFLRRRRGSSSDLSGSENEEKTQSRLRRTRPTRAGTLTSNTNDLLEKQMLEMIAQEAKERQLTLLQDSQGGIAEEPGTETPDQMSKPSSRYQSRRGSLTDISESDHRSTHNKAPQEEAPISRYGKLSIDISERVRPDSIDLNPSVPASPALSALRDIPLALPTSANASTSSSRSSSPSRNPLKKVKQIFRDKSRDDALEVQLTEGDDQQAFTETLSPVDSKLLVPSRSPTARPTNEYHKPHRSMGSVRPKGEDQVGLRGMFKPPRLDTVIRGGVSRLGDMLWKKDTPSETPPEALSADDSESEPSRGRPGISLTLSRSGSKRQHNEQQPPAAKHFLDAMPQFQHVADVQGKHGVTGDQKVGSELSRPQSRQHSRFDLLKPPKLDVKHASDAASPAAKGAGHAELDHSESESYQEIGRGGMYDANSCFSSMMAMPRFDQRDRSQSRHWSITDREPPRRTQLSKREVARMRALIMTSGIKAMEISRRANELHAPLSKDSLKSPLEERRSSVVGVPWVEISKIGPQDSFPSDRHPYYDHYPLASQTLSIAIQSALQNWKASADRFTTQTSPNLQNRIGHVRSRIADDLSGMTREAADQADETDKDLALGQRLKVKHVVDVMEKMMRNRRRRFRWVRRAMWLAVEWFVVGFMWYVWFVVTILRIFLGIGKGVWRGVRWLLWL